ncbi:MAG TPA: TolC family protein [Acetobacteraceae bacterium]|nr:TolC family protein [Acetobacteraceae bacterium]
MALAGCTAVAPLDLSRQATLAPEVATLRHDGFAITQPLSITQVTALAVQNNPALIATRAQHGVAQAQILQAGLLPNPQVTGAYLPLLAGPATTSAWNAGISEDIRSLITLSSTRRAAQASAGQIDAQILWQEWQTIGQARLLSVDIIEADRTLTLLRQASNLLAARYRRSRQATLAGNETLTGSTPDLAAWQAITTQIHDQERQQLARRHQLNALLGLAPDVMLALDPVPDLPPWNPQSVQGELPTLAEHRPDLIALQLGYRAQNAKLRTAILSRFPNLTIGVIGGSDNSNIRNFGPQVTLELPIFNQNQGNIAIETATRQQLHDEYAARLTEAVGQVRAMIAEIDLLSNQLNGVRRELAGARQIAATAEAAFRAGNIDERSYVDLVSTRLTKGQEVVAIEQSLLEQRVAIATLVGAGMPPITLPPGDKT